MEMITIEEYKKKISEMDKTIFEKLAEDSQENTIYMLNLSYKYGDREGVGKIFRKIETLRKKVDEEMEELEFYGLEDDYRLHIYRFDLTDGEYSMAIRCTIDRDGYWINNLFNNDLSVAEVPLCKRVGKLFDNGDIIKVNSVYHDYTYAIYLYDENHENSNGNRHIKMFINDDYYCSWIGRLDLIEKVETCPYDELNAMSSKIKENNGDFAKVFKDLDAVMKFPPYEEEE